MCFLVFSIAVISDRRFNRNCQLRHVSLDATLRMSDVSC